VSSSIPLRCLRRAIASVFFLALPCFAQTKPAAPTAQPQIQIDLTKVGYQGLAAQVRLSGDSHVSLDYLDASHVLITFNPKRLFQRSPDCPPTHNDRMVHAAVMEVPSGNILKETEWYLHDTRRYLWTMGSGRFLLRKLNKLYEVDSSFQERLVLDSPQPLAWISVTPDGKQIITETSREVPANDHSKSEQRVKITFMDTDSLAVGRVIQSHGIVRMEAASSGYADALHKGNVWLVRFGPMAKDRINLARVRTRATPDLLYTSENTILIGRCPVQGDDYSVSALTLSATVLWRQRWSSCRYHPAIKRSEDGSRFAAGTTVRPQDNSSPDANETDAGADLQQTIQVFDTASGNSLLSINVGQPFMDAQNFALSPDGRQMAVFAGKFLDIYSLREMSPVERSQYLAAKADAPGLYVPGPQAGAADTNETVFATSSDEQSADESAENPVPTISQAKLETPATEAKKLPEVEPPALVIRTATKIVGLDLVVTDSKGQPVKGLQRSDFTVTEDGKPQQLSQMAEYNQSQGVAATTATAPVEEKLPPNIFSNRTQAKDPTSVTIVLFDLLNTPVADQVHAQDELVKFLKNKPKDAQFALCTLGNSLQMFQGFTQDEKTLLAAVAKKGSMRHRQLLADDASPTLDAGRETARLFPNIDFLERSLQMQQAELRMAQADQRMYVTMDAFAQLARYLAGIPGRKNIVWLSGSFQLGLAPDPNGEAPYIQGTNYSERVKQTAALMAEAHVAVYPVDVKGLATNPIFTAATNDVLSPISAQGGIPTGPGTLIPRGTVRNAQTAVATGVLQDQMDQFGSIEAGEHATMDKLAADTGGEAFYNTNGIGRAIARATEHGSNYYALSYTPANRKFDGKFRKIKVSIPGKYHLAYRRGYYAADPNAAAKPSKDLMSSLARAAMQHGSPQSRQIIFGAKVVPVGKPRIIKDDLPTQPARKKKKESAPVEMQRYAIEYAVTPTDLRFNQSAEGTYQGVFNFMITSFDDNGRPGASQISQAVPDLKTAGMRDVMLGGVRLHQEVDVPVNSTVMRLGVEDMANSHVGTIEIPLPVKAPPDAPVATHRTMPAIEPD
jgi:VWFA-related protein